MIDDLTQMARSGALDQALVTGHGFYTTDYTKPLLFLADSELPRQPRRRRSTSRVTSGA